MERKRSSKGMFTCQGEPATEAVRSRLQKSLYVAFLEVAAMKGVSPSEYVREAVREAVERDRCGERDLPETLDTEVE